ncbi:MAG: tRNA pseudouridine(38-40) synthase TruA [Neisseriaceae bacterium]
MIRRIAICFAYDGAAYRGWQKQEGVEPTVQATLELAIAKIAQEPVALTVCGRTDKGVHALRQIAHFDTSAERKLHNWIRGVNHYLPADISVQYAREVGVDFHARYCAQRRFYRYLLYPSCIQPIFLRQKVGWTFRTLKVTEMERALHMLLGKQDFSSFRSKDCQAKTALKTLYHGRVYPFKEAICFDFAADGFLHHMIRNIVGALVEVGAGRLSKAQFEALVAAKSRREAPPTFSASGLYFLGARYPSSFGVRLPKLPELFWGYNEFCNQD